MNFDPESSHNGVPPLDEQDLNLSNSDIQSMDYFSIDLDNDGGDMSTCSSVSLPSILDGKRIYYNRHQLAEIGDEEYDIIYEEIELIEPQRIEPSSRFQPVYSSSDDELSFVTFEEELSFYTYTGASINASDHGLRSSNNSSSRSRSRSRSRSKRSMRKVISASDHSPVSLRKRRAGQRKNNPNSAFRMGMLQDQVNKISQTNQAQTDDDHQVEREEHYQLELEENDDFSYKPFGPCAEALLQQRQAGSKRELPGFSQHTTDAIIYANNHGGYHTTSDDCDETSSDDASSFYEEESVLISLESGPKSVSRFYSELPCSSAEKKSVATSETVYSSQCRSSEDGDSIDRDSSTKSLSESVEDDFAMEAIPTCPQKSLMVEMTPKTDLTRKAWATRQRSEVCTKLKHLEEQMNSVYGSQIGSLTTITTAPMSSMGSMPSFRGSYCSIDDTNVGRNSKNLPRDSASSFLNSSSSSLLEKRQQAESKRQQLRLAFDAALCSPLTRSRRSKSSPPTSNHSRSNNKDSASRRQRKSMQMPFL